MELRAYGPAAWLAVGVDDPAGWATGVRQAAIPGVVEVVPAEDTVLVRCERAIRHGVAEQLATVRAVRGDDRMHTVEIEVVYDGPDLHDVADAVGLTADAVVGRHAAAVYTVAFCGFSPGFAYLRGLPAELELPRRATPRTAVPAGSVAIAAHYSAVYPSPSPGGWHLIGRTDAMIWDPTSDEPAVLTPGTHVRFRART